jgi:hypothetical protein
MDDTTELGTVNILALAASSFRFLHVCLRALDDFKADVFSLNHRV